MRKIKTKSRTKKIKKISSKNSKENLFSLFMSENNAVSIGEAIKNSKTYWK